MAAAGAHREQGHRRHVVHLGLEVVAQHQGTVGVLTGHVLQVRHLGRAQDGGRVAAVLLIRALLYTDLQGIFGITLNVHKTIMDV